MGGRAVDGGEHHRPGKVKRLAIRRNRRPEATAFSRESGRGNATLRVAGGNRGSWRTSPRLIREGARTALSARYCGEMIEPRGHGCLGHPCRGIPVRPNAQLTISPPTAKFAQLPMIGDFVDQVTKDILI